MTKRGSCTIPACLSVLAIFSGILVPLVHGQCEGNCVPLDKCRDENYAGTNFFDVRVGRDDEDGELQSACDFYLHVCCNDVIEDDATQSPIPTSSGELLGENQNAYSFETCGTRNTDGAGFRITHGSHGETEFGEFPWMVALFTASDNGEIDNFICGGSLVEPNAVMTAAHCVANRTGQRLIVRAGEWDFQTEAEVRPYQERLVEEIIVHEHYNRHILANDVALLILREPFKPDDHVQLICLPASNAQFDDENCFATGWGKDRFDSPQYQIIMKKVELPVVPHFECQQALRTTRLGARFKLHDTFMCAGGEAGVDTCTGDGGSPLVCPMHGTVNRYQQVGIVAWGVGCGQPGIPGVYVKSSLYTEWVRLKVNGLL